MLLIDLFEVKARGIDLLTTDELSELIRDTSNDINWQFDIDPLNEAVFEAGAEKLKRLEVYISELFRRNKAAAVELWETSCPFAVPGMIPSFLGRPGCQLTHYDK